MAVIIEVVENSQEDVTSREGLQVSIDKRFILERLWSKKLFFNQKGTRHCPFCQSVVDFGYHAKKGDQTSDEVQLDWM